ncbi:MAG TPA: NAD(P)H-dependent oxidoreductase subunit E [Patescibacteria group bacterium]|nr:NAD(P)H-dependent oxidoreductase subunit E [Patescibacteria group bacterium]
MDLHLVPGADPTPEERGAVDAALGAPQSGWDGGRRTEVDSHVARSGHDSREQRHLLLPALQAVQTRIGWISPGALNYVCQRLMVPPAEAYGVATFYAMLSVEPRPAVVAHVCDDIACRVQGAGALCALLERRFGAPGASRDGRRGTWHRSPCLGQCERGPAALLQVAGKNGHEATLAPASAEAIGAALEGEAPRAPRRDGSAARNPRPAPGAPEAPQTLDAAASRSLRLLARVGHVDPGSLDDYRAHGGYLALRRAFDLGPDGVIREVLDAKLMGRGGAAFPTGRKWDAVAKNPVRPHYLVCNADESEPGTFKDRILMERDPFALVEAMTIAAHATACTRGYVYIRGEYPEAAARMETAIAAARARGLLGGRILGSALDFDIEIRRGAGAYICGEETALFNSIEGFRGEPRNKPPFPVQAGLFGKPTVINNVETLVNLLPIVLQGGPAYAAIGTPGSTGPKLFCLSGSVRRPGLYEVPFGATLRELLDLAGGVPEGRTLRTVLLGGAAGGFVTPDELDTPLTFEGTRAIGASLGSGVIMAFDDGVDLAEIVLRIAAFFRDESCGQCVPCRVGTQRQEELLLRLAGGRPIGSTDREAALLDDIAAAMRDASICGLGQTAWIAAVSAVRKLGLFGAVSAGGRT